MKEIGKDKLELLRANFEAVYVQKFFPLLLKFLLNSDPSFTISFGPEELYKCMDYFDCTSEEFASVMRVSKAGLDSLLSCSEQLPEEMSLKLSRTTMLFILGIEKEGSKDAFLNWLFNSYGFNKTFTPDSETEEELYLAAISQLLPVEKTQL